MLDGIARRLIDGRLDRIGRDLARRGVSADQVTAAGFIASLIAIGLVAIGSPAAAVAFVLAGRIADGLDGAVARATAKTDLGGFLDIVCDFVFYGGLPLAFAIADPAANALPAAFLIATFYVNGASFLGFAILAARRGLETTQRGSKSLYFTTGLAEGTETIAVFLAACLWPAAFPALAWGFGILCLITAAARVRLAIATFRNP